MHDLICEIFNIDCDLNSGDISRLADILSVKPINEVKDEIVDVSTSSFHISVSTSNSSNLKNAFQLFFHILQYFLPSLFLILAL